MATNKFTNQFADNLRVARSHTLAAPDDATYNLVLLPKHALVMDVWVLVTVAYVAGTPSLTIGFSGNAETADVDAFLTNSLAQPQSTGLKRASMGTAACAAGKYFLTAAGVLTATVAAGSATTEGTFIVFCAYSVVH
jgi:hypothetical protein